MEDKAIQDLVDRYLLNQVSTDDKSKLLDLMEADPVFAQYVRECEETFRVLRAARNRQLRNKLKSWDAGIQKQKRGLGKGLMFFCVFVLLVISVWCWMAYQYSSVTLAMRSFNLIQENSSKVETEEWRKSIAAFRDKEFEKAIYLFMAIHETDDSPQAFRVHWNILLCQLAMNGPSAEWLEQLVDYSNKTPEPMRSEALRLLHMLKSPLYIKLYRGILDPTFTSVKPKII